MTVADPTVGDVDARPLWRRLAPDALGLGWLVLVGLLYLLPALSDGVFIGSYDALSKLGLSKQPGVIVHNGELGDQIDAIIPWTNLAWTQVHAGHLPLWSPYNGVGLPAPFQLAISTVQPAFCSGVPRPTSVRLRRRHRRDPVGRRLRRVCVRVCPRTQCRCECNGGDRVRVERPDDRLVGISACGRHVVGRLVVRSNGFSSCEGRHRLQGDRPCWR